MRDKKHYNKLWLEYIRSKPLHSIDECPNGHGLVAYENPKNRCNYIITCPTINCDYFDNHTYQVSKGTKLNKNVYVMDR